VGIKVRATEAKSRYGNKAARGQAFIRLNYADYHPIWINRSDGLCSSEAFDEARKAEQEQIIQWLGSDSDQWIMNRIVECSARCQQNDREEHRQGYN